MLRPARTIAAAILTLGLCVLSAASCGDGYSEEDAATYCDQEQAALSQCFSSDVYAQCKSCYEECGSGCDRGGTCPEEYRCP